MMNKLVFYGRATPYKLYMYLILFLIISVYQIVKHSFDLFWSGFTLVMMILVMLSVASKRRRQRVIVIEVDDRGIFDHSSKRMVLWENIEDLKMYYTDAITIHLKDDSEYKPKSWWGRMNYRRKMWLYKSPSYIKTERLEGRPFDNYNQLFDYMEAIERVAVKVEVQSNS